jgi:hypothetical protein
MADRQPAVMLVPDSEREKREGPDEVEMALMAASESPVWERSRYSR